MKHTKLPWKISSIEKDKLGQLTITDNEDHRVICLVGATRNPENVANTQYIVLACNHFEEAVELLKKANREFERIMDVVCDEDRESLFDITEEIEDHLTKIGGSHE